MVKHLLSMLKQQSALSKGQWKDIIVPSISPSYFIVQRVMTIRQLLVFTKGQQALNHMVSMLIQNACRKKLSNYINGKSTKEHAHQLIMYDSSLGAKYSQNRKSRCLEIQFHLHITFMKYDQASNLYDTTICSRSKIQNLRSTWTL